MQYFQPLGGGPQTFSAFMLNSYMWVGACVERENRGTCMQAGAAIKLPVLQERHLCECWTSPANNARYAPITCIEAYLLGCIMLLYTKTEVEMITRRINRTRITPVEVKSPARPTQLTESPPSQSFSSCKTNVCTEGSSILNKCPHLDKIDVLPLVHERNPTLRSLR